MSEAADTVLQRLITHAIGSEREPLEAARLAARLVLGLRSAVGSNRTTAGPEGRPAATGPAEQVRLYKHVWADVDGDGTDELCFAAGSSDFFADCVWALIDPGPHGLRFVNLVEGLDSFRDLQVRDINHDGMLEVICTNLVGSGAFLSPHIVSWDGTTVRELLPTQAFHQGLLETKDIDGDGFDEVLIWEGVWREGTVHWEPQPFNVHIFHAAQNGYELQSTLHTDRLYYPARVIRVSIGIMGLPQAMELRRSSPGAAREQIASGIRAGEVTFEFVARFIAEAVQLNNENFPADALSALDAAADALPHVSDMSDRQLLEYGVWRSRAFSHYLLGQFSEGSQAYAQAVRAAPDSERLPRVEVAGLHRERGMLAWALGSAEEGLVHLGRAHAILLGLDQQLPEVKGELSRLLSNLGLVYASLGAWSEAEHVFGDAAVLDRELERADGQSINFLGLGIVRSANGDVAAALDAFSSGSLVLDPVSDRDREADINLEWGQTLVEAGRITDGLERLKRALFLTSVENLLGQGGRHYFALGEAHLAAANLGLARAYLTRALEVARDVGYVETEWRSLFALARLDQLAAELEHVEANLREAIGVLERMRPHHLPDLLRISFLHTSRVAPYEHLTRLLCDQGRIAEAFAVVERAKTRVLVEQLAMMEISPPLEVDSEFVQQERQLLEELRRNDVMQRDAFLLRPGRPMDLSQSVARAAAALESLWGQMREQGGRAAQYVALRRGEPLSAAQMREILSQ